MNKYVFKGIESDDDYYYCIFESDLDLEALKQLISSIVHNTVCEKYIRMDNDTFIYTNHYIRMFHIEPYDEWMNRHNWKPDNTELGPHATYSVVDLTQALEYEASKIFIRK